MNVNQWLEDRQRARTDLLWLCNEVLHYPDVCASVHGPIIDRLQKFQGGVDCLDAQGRLQPSQYRPKVALKDLQGPRKKLFLDPRGHLKTTVITIAHSVQWIINYYDIRILISTAAGDLAQDIVPSIKSHFQFNEHFRFLFPEYVPTVKSAKDWGSKDSFTVPARQNKTIKESTVSMCTVGKTIAGGHFDVIKDSDLVDKENVKTSGLIMEVINHAKYMEPLLERYDVPPYHGWIDMEGTPYDFSDLYNEKLRQVEREVDAGEEPTWQTHVRSAEVDASKQVTLWPQKFPWQELKAIQKEMGDILYSAQYRCRAVPDKGGLATAEDIIWVPGKIVKELLPTLRKHVTVDLGGIEGNASNDYTCINTTGFDRDGRPLVIDAIYGHFDPLEIIEWLFLVNRRFRPLDIKIEKENHARVLLPFLKREMEKRKEWLNIVAIARDTTTSKKQRIKGLQPWFKSHFLRINEDIPARLEIKDEILNFTMVSRWHDDFLDTLADQMQNGDGGVNYDVLPAERQPDQLGKHRWLQDRFLGFERDTGAQQWVFGTQGGIESENANYHRGTGL